MIDSQKHAHATRGSATVYALVCIGIGLAFSVTLTMYLRQQISVKDPHTRMHDWARIYAREGAPRKAAAFYSTVIQSAPTAQQKHSAVLEMIMFLLKDDDWRPSQERYHMASQYALALAERELTNIPPARVAAVYLQLALTLRDERFLQQANRFLAVLRETGELPFSLNLLEFQTLLAFDLPAPTVKSLDTLQANMQTAFQQQICLQSETRLLWRATRNKKWFDTVGKPIGGETQRETLHILQERLLEHASTLAKSNHHTIAQEALLILAKLGLRRNDMQAAMSALRKAAFNEHAPERSLAAQRLLSLMREEASMEEIVALQDAFLQDQELQHTALVDLAQELETTTNHVRVASILTTIDANLNDLHESGQTTGNLLLKSAAVALERNELDRAKQYLETVEPYLQTENQRIRLLSLQAGLAKQKGNLDHQIHYLYAILARNPTQEVERKTRFSLLQALAKNPMDTVDLAGNAMGATMRFPQDPRTTEGLLTTAQQLENLSLYSAAEAYYRHAILMGTTYNPADKTALRAQGLAMLGQARVLLQMDRNQEANRILRALCTHDLWADVWPAAAPLWAVVAMRQGQHREAIRRWRQTCGPSNDALLPELFGILVPDLTTTPTRQTDQPRPPPEPPPRTLMVATANAAIQALLQQEAYERIEQLLVKMESHAHWRSLVPLQQYRVQVLTQLLAREPPDTVISWMERQAVHIAPSPSDDTLLSTDELSEWVKKSHQLSSRARTAIL